MPASATFKSAILVSLQFGLIASILFTTHIDKLSFTCYALIALSLMLLLWAVFSMQKSKLRISPIPNAAAVLITDGPYRFIRHPMYTAILLATLGLLVSQFSLLRLLLFMALAVVLVIKLDWEEKMLTQKFEAYADYKRSSARLIPWVF